MTKRGIYSPLCIKVIYLSHYHPFSCYFSRSFTFSSANTHRIIGEGDAQQATDQMNVLKGQRDRILAEGILTSTPSALKTGGGREGRERKVDEFF